MILRLQSFLLLLLIFCQDLRSQRINNSFSKEEKDSIILNIGHFFERNYVFPEIGKEIHRVLQEKNDKKEFDTIIDPESFRRSVQRSLRDVVDDKHIILIHLGTEENNSNDAVENIASDLRSEFNDRKEMNFGIPELKVLKNNIGYMKITKFTSPELFGPVIRASTEYLKNVDALILDLRSRGGGRSESVSLLLSYFLPPDTRTFNWYDRDGQEFEVNWTLPSVDGHRFEEIPITILTSEQTFSGSEAFCYVMKHHKRATLIGERTRGGAHTYKEMFASQKFLILVPHARIVSAKTNENWEGKGVIPTIPSSAEEALEIAKMRLIEVVNKM